MSVDFQRLIRPQRHLTTPTRREVVSGFSSLHPIMRMKMYLDRRLGRRTRVDRPVRVYVRGVEINATLVDISESGFGLRGSFADPEIDFISVCIGPRQTIIGNVVWCDGERLGAMLVGSRSK